MTKFKIGARLAAGFTAVIFITIVIVVFAYTSLGGIEKVATVIATDNIPGIYVIGQIQSFQARKLALVLEHVQQSNQADLSRLETGIDGMTQQLAALMSDYERTITTQHDRELFEAVKAARGAFVDSAATVLKASRENRKQEALALVDAQMKPAFLKFSDATQAEG
jgi:methyl-accepting chemotaxis protein